MIDKRMMYAQGQRVGGIMGSNAGSMLVTPTRDGSRPGYYGPDAGHENDPGHGSNSGNGNGGNGNGGGENRPDRTNPNNPPKSYSPPTTNKPPKDNDSPQNQIPKPKPISTPPTFNIHGGSKYTPPTINLVDEVALTGFGKVPDVDYSKVGTNSQYNKNIQLNNQLLNTPYSFKSKIPSLNFIGNTLGKIGYNVNTKFFSDNSIGGKINPATGQPFGYGIDGYKAYMEQRALGNVGAYGGTELSQNAIDERSGGDDGIMTVYNNPNNTDDGDDGDADGDGDVDQTDDFIFRYFDKSGKTLQAGAGGVEDLMKRIRERLDNIFTT